LKILLTILSLCSLASGVFGQNPVLGAANGFSNGGGYNTNWNGSGSPAEIVFDGKKILSKSTNGTYCSGFTFAVVMKAAVHDGLLKGKSVDQVRAFQKDWYGATASAKEKQCVTAAENLGIGAEVSPASAKPGDFVQFWRNNGSGHSAVFLGWEMKEGKRVAISYRSSQSSTGGIGKATEKIGSSPNQISAERIYLARLKSP
jgi:hypothetical protein